MAEKSDSDKGLRRRDILKTAATTGATAAGLSGIGLAANASPKDVETYRLQESAIEAGNRTVKIQTKRRANYQFSVTGLLSTTDAPSDVVNAGTAMATLERGSHEFQFSGDFSEFNLDGDATVTVDGELFDVDSFPHNTLEIIPRGTANFDVSASGRVDVTGGTVERPSDRRATGQALETVTVEYEGELTYLDIDGDVQLTKNGRNVTQETALPSTHPHAAQIKTTRGSHEFELEIGDDAVVTDSIATTDAGSGSVSGRAVSKPTRVRYSGQIIQFERGDGAKIEFDQPANKVRLYAPSDEAVEFTPRATDGIAFESEVMEDPKISVPSGEMRQLKFFGEILGGDIGTLRLMLFHDEYPEAADSALLQHSATVQRHEAFQDLVVNAQQDGRVRYDVGGISGGEIRPSGGDKGITFSSHALTDLERGTEGMLSLSITSDGGVEQAENTIKWKNSRGTIQRMESRELNRGVGASTSESSFRTDEYSFDIPRQPRRVDTQGWIPDPGDWLDPIWDGVDALANSLGVAADTIQNGVQNAVDNLTSLTDEDIILKSGEILIDQVRGASEVAWQLIDELSKTGAEDKIGKTLMSINIVGSFGVSALIGTDVFEALDRGDNDCAACIAGVKIAFEVVCDIGANKGCLYISTLTALAGGVACKVLLDVVCAYTTLALGDAEDICGAEVGPIDEPICNP